MSARGTWHCPPECQGQIVEHAYADTHDGLLWHRITDRSLSVGHADRVRYEVADASECGCPAECDCWDPINREPSAYAWRPSSEREFLAALEA